MNKNILVKKYTCQVDMIINDTLLLKEDTIYIQVYDPVGGRPQSVFTSDRKTIGKITADEYWKISKEMIK